MLLLVQSPCARWMLRNAKTQNVTIWRKERLTDWGSVGQKMGALILKTILRKYGVVLGFFNAREGKMGGAVTVRTHASSRIPLMFASRKQELLAWGPRGTMQAWARWNQRDQALSSGSVPTLIDSQLKIHLPPNL